MSALSLGPESWPGAVADARLTPDQRMSAVLVLLSEPARSAPLLGPGLEPRDPEMYDDWGRAREPWRSLARARLRWTSTTATTALELVQRTVAYDERRVRLALRGAHQVTAAGRAGVPLLDALASCRSWLDRQGDEQPDVRELRARAFRAAVAASPPQLLDLSVLVDGDAWAGPAREAARSVPPDEVAPLVRLLADLGSRKPSQKWLGAVDRALSTPSSPRLLREWLTLAAATDVVPEIPGSSLQHVLGVLFVGTNNDVVRAAGRATVLLPHESWPVGPLGALARRGSAHNGLAGFPEALALKVATAAVDALVARDTAADRAELADLAEYLRRRDLRSKVLTALGRPLDRSDR